MSQHHRLIARTGLASAILTLTLAMGLLAHQAFTTTAPAAQLNPPTPDFTPPTAVATTPTQLAGR